MQGGEDSGGAAVRSAAVRRGGGVEAGERGRWSTDAVRNAACTCAFDWCQ